MCRYQVTDENDLVVFMAHTDTVFPDTEPMPFREDEKKMYAPGVCDDTANLAVMMVSARYFVQRKLRAKCGLLFVANSCEEGLGNLKGSRRIVQDYGSRIREFYTFDGTNLRRVVTSAVGSHRYRVTVRTEGGHSYGAFGNRNAIYYLSSIINTIYTMKVPQKEGVKTTYNVGVIEGGTSVNTIAQEASMLCEYRSNDRECLETMRVFFEKTFEAYRAMGVEVEVTLVGDRPCGGDVPQEKLDAQEYEAQSGGGVVSVKVNGKRELLSLTIDPKVVDPDDVEMLQDLVMAAVNEALRKGEANREETMNKMAPGMGGMGGLF